MQDVNSVDVFDFGRDERVLLHEAVCGAQALVSLFGFYYLFRVSTFTACSG
jgi:hypothetical protein